MEQKRACSEKKSLRREDNSQEVSWNNPSLQFNSTDYVPFRRPNAINISDLVTDQTINLKSISSSTTPSSKVSFEPSEITARSTLHNTDINQYHDSATNRNSMHKTRMSVSDILASSFAPKARKLGENLQGDIAARKSFRSSSSFSSFNDSRSLPRTADLSLLSKNSYTDDSFNRGFACFGSASAGAGLNESEMFAPAELMQSKLISDEISWAQEYAAIPTATLSQQAQAKLLSNAAPVSNRLETPSNSNFMIADDPNYSIGDFFNSRSDNIGNIVRFISPDKCRTPVALVDDSDNTVTTTSDLEGSSKISTTPKIDSKTYTRIPLQTEKSLPDPNDKHAIKDSGNSANDMSYLLSMSAIDRALCNLNTQSNTSGVVERGKKHRVSPEMPVVQTSSVKHKNGLEKMISENGTATLDDTMSFRESLLDASDWKSLQQSISQARSTLNPIIRISEPVDDGMEADNDDWPGTPIKNNRRRRRSKSPRHKSPHASNVNPNCSHDGTTPVNSSPSRACILSNENRSEKEPKSLSSTRLDEAANITNVNCNFEMSPNLSNNHYVSSLVVRSNTLNAAQIKSPNMVSPSHSHNFRMSSPNSYHSPQVRSPTNKSTEFASPNLDTTLNSERQLLGAAEARKVISSPVGSEASSTCSYGTNSAANGRSVSRCSSTSEFCLGDGKQIPLKITNTQLSWPSIKLRSESTKSLQIKNTINKRVIIRVEASGPGFQIVNSQRSSNTITLHAQECRTISISFCPTVPGVAIGKLSFYAPSGASIVDNSFLDIPLFAYGGNASILARNILTGPVGAPFVCMGDIRELVQPLDRIISFYNKGPLLGFALITVDSIGLMIPRLSDAFEIRPRRILIPPKTMVNFHVVFRPKREEIRKIIKKMGGVLTLANLRVICGDEVNRQRIRRLLPQMSEEERCKLTSSSLDLLFSQFPQEMEVTDLAEIKENPNTAMDLINFFRFHEILLTINHENFNDTLEASSLFLGDADETALFRTIYAAADSLSPSSPLGTVEEEEE